jgi:hypothetical protein
VLNIYSKIFGRGESLNMCHKLRPAAWEDISRGRNGRESNNFVTFHILPPYLAVCSLNPTSLRSPPSAETYADSLRFTL